MDNKRKGTNIQTWMSKGLSFLMALLLCVTTVFSVPTVSFAAEGEETAQTATEEQTLPSEGTSVVFKRDSKENENQESTTENGVEANKAESKNAENALKNSVSALQKPQPAGLADGLYKVPLKLKHAYDGERLSMGNGAVIQTATMDVKNGKATLYMQMRGLHFMGMYGHLYKLFQWRSDGNGADPYSFKGKKEPVQAIRTGKDSSLMGELMEFPEILKLTDCDVTKPYVPVCVWVDAMDAIQSGGATSYDQIRQGAGEQSAKLTPDWSKAEKLAAGTDLEAALLQAGIKQYVHDASRDAAKYSAKSYAPYKKALDTLDSLASGELQDANTLFNALQDFKATRHNLVDAKKADLKDLLDQAKQLNAKDYTKESWDALQKAVKDASKTFNKSMANEAEIKNAENALKNAIAALQKPQPAGLADGLYKVPLKLKHAYDGERLSMGNGAVIQTATMDVKNGKATLYMQMRGLHFMGMYGHLYKLFQWRSDGNGADPYSFKGKKEPVQAIRTGKDSSLMGELMEFPEILKLTDCDVTKPYVPVCVWVDAMDAIQSGGATSYDQIRQGAGEQSAKLTPDWSKAEKLAAGTDLEAALLQAGIKQYVHDASRDAAKYSAKSYAPYKKALDTLDSLASGELQDANTLFNALQDFKATRHNLVDAKKADLKDLLDQAKQLNAKDYTKESWDALQKAVKDASKTYYKEKANDAEIKNAENVLKNAIAALQKKEDPQKEQALNELQEQLAAIRVLKESDYTPESWKPLALQKEAAEALLKKQNTTAEELYQQVKALKAAVDGLKKAAPKQMPMLDSKDQAPKVWKKNETKSFTCRIIAPMMNLKSVRVDGNELAKENYSVTEGSTIITLKESYLNSLAAGKHTLTVAFKEGNGFAAGKVEQTFEVKEAQPAPNPDQPKPNPNPDQPTPNPNPTPNPGDSKPQRTEIYYEVPVELMHAYEKKHSMGNPALVHMAKVFVTKDGLSYELEFTGMAFMGMYGHLWNLYYRNEPCGAEEWTPAVILEEKNDKDLENKMRKFPSKFRLNCTGEAQKNLPNLKAKSRVHVTVWVDAMDALTNGAKTYNKIVKGSGAQKAYLEFDWSKAVKHESTQPAPNPDQPAPNPSTPKQKPMVDPKGQAPKVWKKNETKSFTCRIIAPMMNLKNVKVDGNELAKDNYTVTEGSTIITLKELYLNSLAAGKHTLAVAFKEGNSYAAGTVEQTFEVKEAQPAPNPNQPKPNPNSTPNQGNTEQRGSGTSHGTQSKPQGNTKGQSNITSKIYNVPVKLMHAYENRPSMGNPALVKTARVICQSNGKTQVILSINGMEFMNMYGHVWNFFHYVGGKPVAAQVMKWHNDKNLIGKLQKFPYQFSLLRSGKESRIKVRVWVDAMDALKNGAKTYDKIQPGSGAQDAYLVLDWSNATLIQETHSAQIAGGKESANPASSRQEGIVTNASNSDDANAQASDNSFDKSESLETGENNVPVDSGNSASQESSQAAKIDTSDSSHITLAAAVLIGGIGILGLMYYFKNRKKA